MQSKNVIIFLSILCMGAVHQLIFAAARPGNSASPVVLLKSPPVPGASDGTTIALRTPQQLGHDALDAILTFDGEGEIVGLRALLDQGADVTVLAEDDGKNILHYASRLPDPLRLTVLGYLVEYIQKLPNGMALLEKMINERDVYGYTPIVSGFFSQQELKEGSVGHGSGDIIRFFGVYGANFSIPDKKGKTLLDHARDNNDRAVIEAVASPEQLRAIVEIDTLKRRIDELEKQIKAAPPVSGRGTKGKLLPDEEIKEVVGGGAKR